MKSRRNILTLAVAMLVVIAIGGSLLRRSREPSYDGKPLSYWFKQFCQSRSWMATASGISYQQGSDAKHRQSLAALRYIGTDAVPYLVARAFETNPPPFFRRDLDYAVNSLPVSWGLTPWVDSASMRYDAPEALKIMKPPGTLLLSLMKSQLDSPNPMQRLQALEVLGTAGDDAQVVVPYLVTALSRPTEDGFALQSLDWLGSNAASAVPALMTAMAGTNADVAAHTLGSIGPAAAPAIPLIKALFTQTNFWNRRAAYAAELLKIDPGQTDALNFLLDGLTNRPLVNDRALAAYHLSFVGPNAAPAVPALLRILAIETNQVLWLRSVHALEQIGEPAATMVSAMKPRLASADEQFRLEIAVLILEIAPADHEAQTSLTDFISSDTSFSIYAMSVLGDAGPAAKSTVPTLKTALKNKQRPVREAAAAALRQIEAPEKAK